MVRCSEVCDIEDGILLVFDGVIGMVFVEFDEVFVFEFIECVNCCVEVLVLVFDGDVILIDGECIFVFVNIGNFFDVFMVKKKGVEGVGLFCIEFFFLDW